MKKITFTLLTSFICLFSFAQNDFSGTINYEIVYEDLNEQLQAMESMLPKSMKVEIRKGISRTTQPTAQGGETVTLTDTESGETIVLMNIMGNKIALQSKPEDKAEEDAEGPEIEYSEETKEIAGYTCKKAIISMEDGSEVIIYYTDELPSAKVSNAANQIEGFPMEIEINQPMFTMISRVKEVKKEKLKKIKMKIPSDYELKTQEELQQMFGQ